MKCPVCKNRDLAPYELHATITSQRCGECGGQWISSPEFSRWLEVVRKDPQPSAPAPLPTPVAAGDLPRARLCPECGHILARYKVGHALDFALDRCGNCGRS